MIPKYNLLYFKNLLDLAFAKFFEKYQRRFAKIDQNYILMQQVSRSQIEKLFTDVILQAIEEIAEPYDIVDSPNWFFIIGGCNPKDNILLSLKDNQKYFPEKLSRILSGSTQIKYFLKEKDIKIDIVKFNQVCLDVFNKFFLTRSLQNKLGEKYKNVVFITQRSVDCYLMFKILKSIFGRSNCVNLKEKKLSEIRSPIVAVNDLIDKYISNKDQIKECPQFKTIVEEISQYIKLRTNFKT